VDKENGMFGYIRQRFTKISEAKMKAWIFVGLQIKQLLEDQGFYRKRDWKGFENVCRNFLGSEKLLWNYAAASFIIECYRV